MQKSNKGQFEKFDASRYKIGIVVAMFNSNITEKMLAMALKTAEEYKIRKSNIKIIKVPGSIEIPIALDHLAKSKKYNTLLAIGCVIRGKTPHFEYVNKIVSEGVLRIILDYHIPVGFGILTTENLKQAEERIPSGKDAMIASLEMAKIIKGNN